MSSDQEKENLLENYQTILTGLLGLYKEKILTDVTVVVGERRFDLHRIILSGQSDYFKSMFTSGMQEQHQQEIELKSPNLTSEAFEVLVHQFYTSELNLTLENMFDVLTAADHLQATRAVEETCKYIIERCIDPDNLNVPNCLSILQYVEKYCVLRIDTAIDEALAKNFRNVLSHSEGVKHLGADRIYRVLTRDDLSVVSEIEILRLVLLWIRYDSEKRLGQAAQLLREIRLGLVEPTLLCEIFESEPLAQSVECRELYHEAMVYHALPTIQASNQANWLWKPRNTRKVLLAVSNTTAKYYDVASRHWRSIPSFPITRSSPTNYSDHTKPAAILSDGSFVYLAGGDIHSHLPSPEFGVFNTGNVSWKSLSHMKQPRVEFSLCLLGEHIYAVGGHDHEGFVLQKSSERYNLRTGHWQLIAPLGVPRFNPAVVEFRGHLYAIGGQKDKFTALRTVERFNPGKNQWEELCRTQFSHAKAGAIVVDDKLFVMGGFTNADHFQEHIKGQTKDLAHCRVAEIYDLENNQWSLVDQSFIPPGDIPAFQIQNQVFLVLNGYCFDTGIGIGADQVYYIDLDNWQTLCWPHDPKNCAITEIDLKFPLQDSE